MMRYRDLMHATLTEGLGEHLPVAAWQHHPVADQDADAFIEATLAFQARFDSDFVKLTPASTWQSRDHGLTDAWDGDYIGRRTVLAPVVTTSEDWRDISPLDPCAGFSARIVSAAAKVRRRLPAHVPVIATVFNPVFQASQLRGFKALLDDARDRPGLLRPALDVLRANTVATIAAFRDAGVDGIFYVTQHANTATTVDEWQVLSLADDLVCIDAMRGQPFNFLHLHGAAVHADLYAGAPVILHYDHSQDNARPADLATRFPHGLSSGPCAHTTLVEATPVEIAGQVTRLRQSMAGQPFILAPGCAVPLTARPEQIDAVMQAARRPQRLAA